jgi:hypothetical protein
MPNPHALTVARTNRKARLSPWNQQTLKNSIDNFNSRFTFYSAQLEECCDIFEVFGLSAQELYFSAALPCVPTAIVAIG